MASKSDTTSTDLVVLDTDQVHEILTGNEPVDFDSMVSDPAEVQKGMVARILAAESADDALTQGETIAARDIVGLPIEITGVRWLRSRVENASGIPVYAAIDATDGTTGEKLVVTCGALQVIAQLVRFSQLDAFPLVAKFGTTEKPTAQGYYPLWLEKVQ